MATLVQSRNGLALPIHPAQPWLAKCPFYGHNNVATSFIRTFNDQCGLVKDNNVPCYMKVEEGSVDWDRCSFFNTPHNSQLVASIIQHGIVRIQGDDVWMRDHFRDVMGREFSSPATR